MIRDHLRLLHHIRTIHAAIRDTVVEACERTALEQLAAAVGDDAGDTIFAIDRISEEVLLAQFAVLAQEWSFVLIAEGLGNTGIAVFPSDCAPDEAELRIIIDPIDGTRGLMYQKRPAWILTGVAANKGDATTLADIELAIQTEIPLVKQHLCDSLWAVAGEGATGERLNRLTGERQPLALHPSHAPSIAQGYGSVSRFFPGARDVLAAIDEAIISTTLGPAPDGRALAFEDQYVSTGGQLYELIMGHDRWIADLRPLVAPVLAQRGMNAGLFCHPYDLCTELIARSVGVVVSNPAGQPLRAPLDVTTGLAWVGYANAAIRDQVMPALQAAIQAQGLELTGGDGHVAA